MGRWREVSVGSGVVRCADRIVGARPYVSVGRGVLLVVVAVNDKINNTFAIEKVPKLN